MSLTSGFFNSLNGDRKYNAEQMSAIFDGIINDGVFANVGTAFRVLAVGGLVISVGDGRAWFNSTWIHNDSAMQITMSASEVLQDRYDAVVIEVDRSESIRAASIKVINGTPSTSPNYPILENTVSKHQYPLAFIRRKANSTSISTADIINCIGGDYCPYVTGVLQVQSMERNVAQWEAEFDEWTEEFQSEVNDWFQTVKDSLGEAPATELANRIANLTTTVENKVNKSGDTMSGPLHFHKTSNNGTSTIDRDETTDNRHGLYLKDVNAAGREVGMRLCSGADLFEILVNGQWYKLYSALHKPTPADIGALPTSGGSLSGVLTIENTAAFEGLVKQRRVNNVVYNSTIGVGSDGIRGVSACLRLSNAAGTIFGRIDVWSNGTITYFDGSNYYDIISRDGGRFASGTYTGVGRNGYDNVNNLSFSFKPKLLRISRIATWTNTLNVTYSNAYGCTFIASAMTTEYKNALTYDEYSGATSLGKSMYTKLSSDGKTIYWYSIQDSDHQLNRSSAIYYYHAFG